MTRPRQRHIHAFYQIFGSFKRYDGLVDSTLEMVFPRSDRAPSNLLCKTLQKATCFPDQLARSVCSNVSAKILFLNVVSSFKNTNRIPWQEKSRRFTMRTRRSKDIGFLQQHLLKYASLCVVCQTREAPLNVAA